jgi:hypothetical protein
MQFRIERISERLKFSIIVAAGIGPLSLERKKCHLGHSDAL